MGYKSTGIFIDQTSGPYFGTSPALDLEGVTRLLAALNYTALEVETIDIQEGSWTRDDDVVFVGSYANGAFISNQFMAKIGGADRPTVAEISAAMKPLIQLFPNGKSLFWYIYDTVNAYTYAYFEGDSLVRAFAGSMDESISLDYGALQPEDQLVFTEDDMGNRSADIDDEYESLDSVCGEIVLEFTKRFLGNRISEFDGSLLVQKIKVKSTQG